MDLRRGRPTVGPQLCARVAPPRPRPASGPGPAPRARRTRRRRGSRPIVGQRVLDARPALALTCALDDARAPRAPSCARTSRRSERSGTACAISREPQRPGLAAGPSTIAPVQRRPISSTALVVAAGTRRRRPCASHARGAYAVARSYAARRRLAAARLLDGAVDRDVAGDVDHRGEALQRDERDRLQELLVGPAGLARLLVQVRAAARRCSVTSGSQVAQQRGLARRRARPTRGRSAISSSARPGLRARRARAARGPAWSA